MAKKQNKDETNHCFLLSCIVGLEVTALASLSLLTYALYSMSTSSALAVATFGIAATSLSTLLPFLAVGFLAVAFIIGGLSCCRNDGVSYTIGVPGGPVHTHGMWGSSTYSGTHVHGHGTQSHQGNVHGHETAQSGGNVHGHGDMSHHGHDSYGYGFAHGQSYE